MVLTKIPDAATTTPITFTAADVGAIERVGTAQHYPAGATIFSLGDSDRRMFYLASGTVQFDFGANKPAKTIAAGTIFGELAHFFADVRSATAKAVTACTLICLDQSAADQLLREHPRLLFTLFYETARYLKTSEERLITDLQRHNEELQKTLDYLRTTKEERDIKEIAAQTDDLTLLYNRRYLNAHLPKFIQRAALMADSLGVVMLDLDHFKQVNDTWGHHQGDAVLQQAAAVLKGKIRKTDVAIRLGGDEFLMILPGIPPSRARSLAEQVRRDIDQTFAVDAARIKITSSVGATCLRSGDTAESLLERADKLLYAAKAQGRNCVVFDA